MAAMASMNHIKTPRCEILLLLALIACGLVSNHFPFSILNAHFVFVSILAVLAPRILGWDRGVIAAGVISAALPARLVFTWFDGPLGVIRIALRETVVNIPLSFHMPALEIKAVKSPGKRASMDVFRQGATA